MDALNEALAGLKVLDFSQGIAGPHGACLLAEMGAEVVKIEPPGGDWLRGLGVKRNGSSVLFGTYNRGKKGLVLDLKQASARDAALRLIAQADVVIESNRPGVMARLGLDHATARAANPALVYASVTGFGQSGPYVDRPATDAVVQAYTGFSFGAGDMHEPIRVRISVVDVVTGVYTSQAILGALLQRGRTGQGRHLDISLMHCITAVQGYKYAEHEATGGALGKELFAGIGIYRTADGFVALSAMKEQQVVDLMRLIGQGVALEDARYATPAGRFENQDALRALIARGLAAEPSAHWLPRMRALDLICQPVLDYAAYRVDEQVLASQLFQSSDLGQAGILPTVRMPGLQAEEADPAAPPSVGEHSREVLARFGFDATVIDALCEAPR
ncbi:CoA transferase [Variovorax sp.]|jgi:crotonobetainyl-CoA:carnitine CoA-transferase CaiB-like acyl-CoA transferase|uniref:CaiB/BaiF CoA transferase family protein n=1 Tax=Variovorax sp. TaxID=1871043 RepID=UPI000C4EA599|nr:CoA transferase [Variovorax sp.]MBS77755.1 CoA transferase [Variovorax sp.]